MASSGWSKREVAEVIGTFVLTFAVAASIAVEFPIATPLVAGLTLGLFVYSLGPVSGAHFNPAVTLALLGIRAINGAQAVRYIISQLLGAALAYALMWHLRGGAPTIEADNTLIVAIFEAIGAFVFVFGIAAVVHKKVPGELSGVVIGSSLTLGAMLASIGSNGVLNPAVAAGIGSLSFMYVLGPILGALLAAQCYGWFCKK